MKLERTDKIEPAQWNVWFMSWTRPRRCFSLYAVVVGRLNVLFSLFFFQLILHRLYFGGRRVPSYAIWQSDRNKFTNKNPRKTGLQTQQGWQKMLWFRIRLGESEVTLWYFSSNDKKPSPSEELEESKEVQESKGKGIFSSVVKQAKIALLTWPTVSKVAFVIDLEGSFVFLWEYLQSYLSFGKCFLKKY